MSSAEFLSTTPLGDEDDEAPADRESPSLKEQSHNLMRLSLRFDPYSATAADDYEDMRKELEKGDILMLLKSELAKSRIHTSLTKKIVSAIRYIDESKRDGMVMALIENSDLLYPIYANVLFVAKDIFTELRAETRL